MNKSIELPSYHDGIFQLYKIKQGEERHPIDYIVYTELDFYYQELSISDRLRYEFEGRERKITMKIRIPQTKTINTLCVVKIDEVFHKVYNAYHFTNKEGFSQTDLTLEEVKEGEYEER